jgi:hypothetical protein
MGHRCYDRVTRLQHCGSAIVGAWMPNMRDPSVLRNLV